MLRFGCALGLIVSVLQSSVAYSVPGDVLFEDDFETGSLSDYTLVEEGGFPDESRITYGFDLSRLNENFSGEGLLMETDDAITAFVNGVAIPAGAVVSVRFDAFARAVSGGSTEYLTAGVGGPPTTPGAFAPFDANARAVPTGDGVFIAASTDSGFRAAGDFAIVENNAASSRRLSFMDAAGNADSGIPFSTILPRELDRFGDGILENRQVEMEVLTDGERLQWLIDGFLLSDVTATVSRRDGAIGIGINDPFRSFNNDADGLGTGTGTAFAIDNLRIVEADGFVVVPEPGTLALAGLLLVGGLRRGNAGRAGGRAG